MAHDRIKNMVCSAVVAGFFVMVPQAMAEATGMENAALEELRQIVMAQQRQIAAQAKAIESLQASLQTQEAQAEKSADSTVKSVVRPGSDKVSLTLYGQVNRAVMFADDGKNSEVYHVDNDNSSTRFGMKGSAKANDDLTAGFKFEAEYEGNSSNTVNLASQSSDASLKQRHMDFYLDSVRFGKISVGQGDTASNGTSEVDLSGTTVIGFSDQPKMGGKIQFYDNLAGDYAEKAVNNPLIIADVIGNMDGLSRRDRLRYDTPKWQGLYASASAVEKNGHDLALRYSVKMGETQLAAALAYAIPGENDNDVNNQVNGSASILLNNGLNATFATGRQALSRSAAGNDDPTFWYGKLGYIAKIFAVGSTNFAIDYGQYHEMERADDEADTFGIMVVQNLRELGTEIYASFRTFSLEQSNADMEDIDIFMTGARIRF